MGYSVKSVENYLNSKRIALAGEWGHHDSTGWHDDVTVTGDGFTMHTKHMSVYAQLSTKMSCTHSLYRRTL